MAKNVTNEAGMLKEQPFGLKRLVALARPHWRPLSLATIALMLGSGISLMYPQAARLLVDEVFVEGSEWDISTIGFALLALFLVQSVFVSVRYYLFTVTGDRVVADLRQRLFRSIVVRDMGFFDATKTGELTSRLTSDTQILQSAVTTNLSMALRYGMQAIGGIVVCFVTSVKLSLVILVLLPVVFTVAIVYGRRVRKLSREVQDAVADSTSLAEEALSGIRTVRSFAREGHEAVRYDGAIERSFDLAKTRSMLGSVFSGGMSFLGYATIAVILWLGSVMVMNGEMTGGELVDVMINTCNVEGVEMSSILPVRSRGKVYYFNMATSFSRAALGSEGVGKDVDLLIGNGYAEDHAELALDMVRKFPVVRRQIEALMEHE